MRSSVQTRNSGITPIPGVASDLPPAATRKLVLANALLLSLSCRRASSTPEHGPRTPEAGNFTVMAHEGVTDAQVASIIGALDSHAPRIRGHLRLTAR